MKTSYIKSVFNGLTTEQLSSISNADTEYILFDVSVFNAGHTTRVELTDELDDSKTEDGYSFYMTVDEAQNWAFAQSITRKIK